MASTRPRVTRDPLTPAWWLRTFAVWTGVVYGAVGLGCLLEPARWFSAPSLRAVHDLIPVPWPVYGLLFSLVAVGIVTRPTRLSAYFLGFMLAAWFASLQLYFTILADAIINLPGTGLIMIAPLVPLAGVRYAELERRIYRAGRR